MPADSETIDYKFSGHETFPFRYTWLPKAARGINQDPLLLTAHEEDAMVILGVGKNMVRSIRFWAEATRIIQPRPTGGHQLTAFGRDLLLGTAQVHALDPYLEDVQTLWLIHWNISTNSEAPLFGWDFLLNRWQEPHLSLSTVMSAFTKEGAHRERPPSEHTLEQVFEVFVHTYLPTRGRKGEVREDNLDCPLVELQLLLPDGLRSSPREGARHEPQFRFRREAKPDVSSALFAYCLDDFWRERHRHAQRLRLQDVVSGHGSPGQIFKLPEEDIRSRVESLHVDTNGAFVFSDSAAQPAITRTAPIDQSYSLAQIYNSVAA